MCTARITVAPDTGGGDGRKEAISLTPRGDMQNVVAILSTAAAKGVPPRWRSLVTRPELAPLRGSAELERIIASIRAEAARQAALGNELPKLAR